MCMNCAVHPGSHHHPIAISHTHPHPRRSPRGWPSGREATHRQTQTTPSHSLSSPQRNPQFPLPLSLSPSGRPWSIIATVCPPSVRPLNARRNNNPSGRPDSPPVVSCPCVTRRRQRRNTHHHPPPPPPRLRFAGSSSPRPSISGVSLLRPTSAGGPPRPRARAFGFHPGGVCPSSRQVCVPLAWW